MKTQGIEVALVNSNEVKFMLNTPHEDINPNVLKFGYINNVIPNINDKTLVVDFGVQYAYNDEPILECRYMFHFSYREPEEAKAVISTKDGVQINDELMRTILNIAVGAVRGIMIARTAGSQLTKFPLPILDLKMLEETARLIPTNE